MLALQPQRIEAILYLHFCFIFGGPKCRLDNSFREAFCVVIKQTRLIDDRTGEIVSDKKCLTSPMFDDEKGYLLWPRKSFSKSFHDVDFPVGMNDLEIGRMARLAKRIFSNTNMLGYRGNGGVKPYSIDMIGNALNLKQRQARKFVDKMIQYGVMAKVKIESEERKDYQLYVNPIYFFSSNRIPLNLYLIFRKQLDEVLPEWVKMEFMRQRMENR